MNVSFVEADNELIVKLDGDLDHHGADLAREEIDSLLREHNIVKLIMDFKGLDFIDSSGIGFVIGRYKNIRKKDGTVEIVNSSKKVRKILDMSGIGKIIRIK